MGPTSCGAFIELGRVMGIEADPEPCLEWHGEGRLAAKEAAQMRTFQAPPGEPDSHHPLHVKTPA
jgi:hypothetical protein